MDTGEQGGQARLRAVVSSVVIPCEVSEADRGKGLCGRRLAAFARV
jgi:hypothetical protein